MTNKSFSKQLPLNLISNVGVFLLGIIINLFLTPFYIKYIGVDGLGVISLALTIPVYAGLASLIISGSVSRFLTIDLHQNDYKAANETFNTAFFGILIILAFVLPLLVMISYNISNVFDIPEHLRSQTTNLFLGILIASSVAIFTSMFMIPAYANNRLDINNFTKIITILVQSGIIVIMFIFVFIDLAFIGLAYFMGALVGLLLSIIIWKKFAPDLMLNIHFFNFSKLKEISSMGSWILVNQMGSILFLYIDLIVINLFFGAEKTGDYSIVLQWSTLLRAMAGIVAGVIGPIILISYAKKNFNDVEKYAKFAVKFMGILIAIPIGLLMGFGEPLFSLWLGNDFIKLVPLLWLMIGHLVINLSVIPLFSIQTAYNKVKIPGVVTLGLGIINIFLAILLAVTFDLGIYGVALAGAVILTMKNTVFTPIYAAHILGINKFFFMKNLLIGPIVLLFSFSVSFAFSWFRIDGWLELIVYASMVVILLLVAIWKIILNNDEKKLVLKMLPVKFRKVNE